MCIQQFSSRKDSAQAGVPRETPSPLCAGDWPWKAQTLEFNLNRDQPSFSGGRQAPAFIEAVRENPLPSRPRCSQQSFKGDDCDHAT